MVPAVFLKLGLAEACRARIISGLEPAVKLPIQATPPSLRKLRFAFIYVKGWPCARSIWRAKILVGLLLAHDAKNLSGMLRLN